MIPFMSKEVQELLKVAGLALLGVALLIGFGVALGMST